MALETSAPTPDDGIELTWNAGNHPGKNEVEAAMTAPIAPDEVTKYDDPTQKLPSERGLTPEERAIHNFGKDKPSDQLPN
jgi:hypothetical protein